MDTIDLINEFEVALEAFSLSLETDDPPSVDLMVKACQKFSIVEQSFDVAGGGSALGGPAPGGTTLVDPHLRARLEGLGERLATLVARVEVEKQNIDSRLNDLGQLKTGLRHYGAQGRAQRYQFVSTRR